MQAFSKDYGLNDTRLVAKQLLRHFADYRHFAFSGEVGTGKTTLVQAMCRELGVGHLVDSPTFSLVNEYESAKGRVVHVDLYRLEEQQVEEMGLEAYDVHNAWWLVEWPERAPGLLHDEMVLVKLAHQENGRHMEAFALNQVA